MANGRGPGQGYGHGNHILQQFVHPFLAQQMQPLIQSHPIIPDEILDELLSRFVLNIPEEERQDPTRVCFQMELAHWFFVDNYCGEDKSDYWKELGHIKFLPFTAQIFRRTPFLQMEMNNVEKIVQDFRKYKQKVPTFGAVLMDQDLTKVVLVQGFGGQWGFPKGKINKDEDPAVCAAREVLEETGYDCTPLLNRNHYIESCAMERWTRLYIVRGVDPNFILKPHTRYEIKNIGWFPIKELPECKKDPSVITRPGFPHTAFHNVFPYIKRLRRWIDARLTGKKDINFFKSNAPNRPEVLDRVAAPSASAPGDAGDRNRQLSGSGSSQSVGSGKSMNNSDPFSSSFNMAMATNSHNNAITNTNTTNHAAQPSHGQGNGSGNGQGTKYFHHPFQFQSPFSTPQKQLGKNPQNSKPNQVVNINPTGTQNASNQQQQHRGQPPFSASSAVKTADKTDKSTTQKPHQDSNSKPSTGTANQNLFIKTNINPKRRLFTSQEDLNDPTSVLQSKMTKLKISPRENSISSTDPSSGSGSALVAAPGSAPVPVQTTQVPVVVKLESIFGIPLMTENWKIKQEPKAELSKNQNQVNPVKLKLSGQDQDQSKRQVQVQAPIVSLTSSTTWLNFKLDTDQILGAMKISSCSVSANASSQVNASSNISNSAPTSNPNSSKRRNRRK